MVDNHATGGPHFQGQVLTKVGLGKTESTRLPEHLLVSYQIEKTSGMRTNKKSNSFKAATSTNLKTIIQAVIKKVKFSTRYKYAILYFDTNLNSKYYAGWRKFKDKLDWIEKTQIKLRVCRYKVSNLKPIAKPQIEGAAENLQVPPAAASPMQGQRINPFLFSSAMSMYFFTYMMYLNAQRMRSG